MNLKRLSTSELKLMLETYKGVSMGVKDIVFTHAIEDELDDRRHINELYREIEGDDDE